MNDNARNLIEVSLAVLGITAIPMGVWVVSTMFKIKQDIAVLEERMNTRFDNIKSMLAERRPRS